MLWKIKSVYIESLYGNICTVYLDNSINSIKVKNLIDGKNVEISELKPNDIGNKLYFSFNTDMDCEYEILAE